MRDLTIRNDRTGEVSEFRQPPIEPSSYQARLAAGEDPTPAPQTDDQDPSSEKVAEPLRSTDLRYWSDYNRLYYHPRTIQALPDVADWENVDGNWSLGKQTFDRFNAVCAYNIWSAEFITDPALAGYFFDGRAVQAICGGMRRSPGKFISMTGCRACLTVRLSLAGPSLNHRSLSFWILYIFTAVRLPRRIWNQAINSHIPYSFQRSTGPHRRRRCTQPLLHLPSFINLCRKIYLQYIGIRNAVNDVLCLRSLNELSTMNVPLQNPDLWRTGSWSEQLNFDVSSLKARIHISIRD